MRPRPCIAPAARTVTSPADADYLFTAMANLTQLAKVAGSPDMDVADIERWRETLSARAAELRRQQALTAAETDYQSRPTLQMGPAVREPVRQRATA